MDSRDEELTLKNVDEQIERYLSQPQASPLPVMKPLPHVVRNLQNIYDEERRLEHIWVRINSGLSANSDHIIAIQQTEEIPTIQSIQEEIKPKHIPGFTSIPSKANKQPYQLSHRKKWYTLGIGLVAAILLITFLIWPLLSYALHPTQTASIQPTVSVSTATPQSQPTTDPLNTKAYIGQYFKLQYPANWVITSTTPGEVGVYLQTTQFRPSATSSVFVNVNAMLPNNYSANQLLHMDPDLKLGTLVSTNAVTYNGRSWTVGIVELAGYTHVQAGKLEIAYSTQGSSSYRIEFGAASDMFSSHTKVFNTIFASFYAQKTETKAGPTATPTTVPTATPSPIPTPSPTTTNAVSIKVYTSLYFTLQYPANWVITNISAGGLYQQTVQFRPSATSPIFVNINVMYSSDLSSSLLLLIDPELKLGTLLDTNTVIYNGLSWVVGTVNLLGSTQTQPSTLEVAYSNQKMLYKIEFSAPPDQFSSYKSIFDTMFGSFHIPN